MDLNLDALYAFTIFAETKNFTRAAEVLKLSQPALHVKIRKLSESLGLTLYEKNGRELELTHAGIDLARFANELQFQIDGFIDTLLEKEHHQAVILAAGAGSYRYLLGDTIRRFKKHSNNPLQLITADRAQTLELLHHGKAHMGVSVLEEIPEDLDTHHLISVPAKLIIPKTHPLSRHKKVSVRDLSHIELIVPQSGKPQRRIIDRTFTEASVSWKAALETTGWELMMHFVSLGLGAAIINACCDIPKGLLGLPIKEFPSTNYYLISKRSLKFTPEQQHLYSLIKNSLPSS